jgi:hypothetical protein
MHGKNAPVRVIIDQTRTALAPASRQKGLCVMWDVLRWHNGTLSIAWWAMIGFAILVIIAAGARAAK